MSRIHRAVRALAFLLLAATPLCALAATLTPPPVTPVGPEIEVVDDAAEALFDVFDDGSYVVAWRDPDDLTLHARLFSADDRPLGEPFEVGPVTVPPRGFFPGGSFKNRWAVKTLGGDGHAWALAWGQPACDTCPYVVHLSLYDGDVPRAEAELVASGDTDRYNPVLATGAGAAGPVAVGWTADNVVPVPPLDGENFSDVFARLYEPDGTPRGVAFQVNEDEFEEQLLADATFLPSGDLVFVWESYEGEGLFYDVVHRRFDPQGVARGGEARVHADQNISQFAPVVTTVDGGYLVVWTDWAYSPGFDGALVGRRFFPDGTPMEPEFPITPPEPRADRDEASAAGAADGSFVVLWNASCSPDLCNEEPDGPDGSSSGVFGRTFAPFWQPGDGGGDDSGEIPAALRTAGFQGGAVVRAASPNGYLALWLSRSPQGPLNVVVRRLAPAPCSGLCLGHDRFEATVEWTDFRGNVGSGIPVPRGDDWGTFWFFRPSNVELAVKVLDGGAINGHFWVFNASLTNVGYTLTVTDHVTGRSYAHVNPVGHFGSRGDTLALPSAPAGPAVTGPARRPAALTPVPGPCTADRVCLNDDRFLVEVEWQTASGASGDGVGAKLSGDTGWFWFFRPGNPEVLVKVLDGRPVNGHFWVFHAALSNVGFTLRVTDRQTDESVTYVNPVGQFPSRGDTAAFPAP